MYLKLILIKARFLGALSRLLKLGNGVMVAGRFILRLAPNAVVEISKDMRVVLVSGTNGKSTTAKLIAEALGTKYSVAHNQTGANLFAGVAAALGANPKAEVAVLEVDELVLPWAIQSTNPELLVLLNLGRDQLDRLSEVRIVASKWRTALESNSEAKFPKPQMKVLASTDDPFVVYAAKRAKQQIWFSASELGHLDAATCPECGALLHWTKDGANYWCNCGFAKPDADWKLSGNQLIQLISSEIRNLAPEVIEVVTAIPGKAALQNAARALIAANTFDIDMQDAREVIGKVRAVDGRFEIKRIGATNFRLLLSKNPASWRETLATSASGPEAVLLSVNANTQDGKDTSWLWDVDFKPLTGRKVLVTGDRRLDVSARLIVDEVAHQVVESESAAAQIFGDIDADLIASYTAFHRLNRLPDSASK